MAHGTADYGVTAGRVTTYQLTDLGELAVRLGSIVTFDRRGDVLFYDGFENGVVRWILTSSGTGGAAALDATTAHTGTNSILLTAGTDVSQDARMQHNEALPSRARLGFEFSMLRLGSLNQVDILMQVRAGASTDTYWARYLAGTNTLQVRDSGGAFQTVATDVVMVVVATLFYPFKLVIDPSTGKYERIVIAGRQFDVSAYTAAASPVTTPDSVRVLIINQGTGGGGGSMNVDDAIITTNEPANP